MVPEERKTGCVAGFFSKRERMDQRAGYRLEVIYSRITNGKGLCGVSSLDTMASLC